MLFVAHYFNLKTGLHFNRSIWVYTTDDEKAAAVYAMGKAYDGKTPDELFESLEFVME